MALSGSKLYHCTYCPYKISSAISMTKHTAKEHPGRTQGLNSTAFTSPPMRTDKDSIIHFCHNTTAEVQYVSSLKSLISPERVDTGILEASFFDAWKLFDDSTPFDVQKSIPVCGFARKSASTYTELTLSALEFIIYLQQRGENTGTNTLPSQGTEAMLYKGTARGATIFEATEKDRLVMAPNPAGTREFKLHEVKDAQQIKYYLRRPLPELEKMRKKMAEKAAEFARQLCDPLRKAIFSLGKPQLIAKSKRVARNHVGELAEEFSKFTDINRPPAELRALLLNVVISFGRCAQDVGLFIAM